jgi:hypothetical protein
LCLALRLPLLLESLQPQLLLRLALASDLLP